MATTERLGRMPMSSFHNKQLRLSFFNSAEEFKAFLDKQPKEDFDAFAKLGVRQVRKILTSRAEEAQRRADKYRECGSERKSRFFARLVDYFRELKEAADATASQKNTHVVNPRGNDACAC